MEKIKNKVISCFLIVFIIFFSWISINNVIHYYRIIYEFSRVELALGIIIYIILVYLISTFVIPKIQKIKAIKFVMFVIILAGIFYSVFHFRVDLKWANSEEYTWDMGNVYSNALRIAEGDFSDCNYLRAFPNNIMITLFFSVILKIGMLCGVNDLVLYMGIFNGIIIFLSIVLMYINAKGMYGEYGASILLVIAMFCTPMYLYAPIFYTDTISMLFMMLILFFLLGINQSTKKINNIVLNIALGIIALIGMKIKLTTIFLVIGYGIYTVLHRNIKFVIKKFGLSLLVFCACALIYTNFTNKYIIKGMKQSQVPVEHWILMGLNDDGNFNGEDYLYTMGYKTYDEKKEADIRRIKERIQGFNKKTFVQHLNKKLVFTWGDGTYYAPVKLGRQPHKLSPQHEYILRDGLKTKYFKQLPQAMQGGMIIYFIISAVGTLLYRKNECDKNIPLLITIFGFALFLLIWENRSRYILTALPLMLIVQVDGIIKLKKYWSKSEVCISKNDKN